MIEIKVKGPLSQKRTIIDSLRCQFIKEKDKLYMMRFKSLPNHRKVQRNPTRVDIAPTVKISNDQILPKVIQNLPKQKQDALKDYLDSSIQEIDPHLLLRFYQQNEQTCRNRYEKKTQRVKSMAYVERQNQKQRRLCKTIEDQSYDKDSHSSLRDYINKFFNLKQIYVKRDKELIDKITHRNAEQLHSYKRKKNFKPIAFIRKDPVQQKVQQDRLQNLFNGKLSPNICYIRKLEAQDLNAKKNLLKRVKRQKTIQNSLLIKKNQQSPKLSPLKEKKKVIDDNNLFKNSLGPWISNQID